MDLLLVEPQPIWRKKKSTLAPASESPLQRHQPQMKSTDVTIMVGVTIVVVGIAAGRFLLLGKEQLAKPFPTSLWSVPRSSCP